MLVARSFEDIQLAGPALLTIGTFDGVHRGHRFLLEQARARARDQQYGMVVVTFDPCPAVVLRPSIGRYQLTTAEQKQSLLAEVDPAVLAMLEFTPQLSYLTASEFMDALEARLELREVWFGEDFRFGRDRGGDLNMLVERGRHSGFSLHVVSRRTEDKQSISSSRIRKALSLGDVEGALPLLGYPFRRDCANPSAGQWITGTASASRYTIDPWLALPADGIYAVIAAGASGVAPTTSEVQGEGAAYQLILRGPVNDDGMVQIEFIVHLCPRDEYLRAPAGWEARATELLGAWRRPEYRPAGHF